MNMYRIPAISHTSPLELPNMAILVSTPQFEPISMNEDDCKLCEHLLSQDNGDSYSNPVYTKPPLNI